MFAHQVPIKFTNILWAQIDLLFNLWVNECLSRTQRHMEMCYMAITSKNETSEIRKHKEVVVNDVC